jgi:hypothetical protein
MLADIPMESPASVSGPKHGSILHRNSGHFLQDYTAAHFRRQFCSLHAYCNGPLPLNGQLVTDVISAVTDTDSYPITRNGWAKRIRGNRYAL